MKGKGIMTGKMMICALAAVMLAGCAAKDAKKPVSVTTAQEKSVTSQAEETVSQQPVTGAEDDRKLSGAEVDIEINGRHLTAELADNVSAQEFAGLMKDEPLTLELEEYAGFEKVGDLPQEIITADEEIRTECGDLVLYQGKRFSIYYGINEWNFTRLGKIKDTTEEQLKEILGDGDVTVTISLK